MAVGTFATAINCIDGRVQRPVADWLKIYAHVDYIDAVNMPGADGMLVSGDTSKIQIVRENLGISIRAHASALVAIAGHHECAAFPVSRDEHLAAIRQAMKVVASWGYPVQIVGLYVNEQSLVEEVSG